MIPPFDERGKLPPGIHKATWNEVEIRFGQSPKRRYLLAGLREALTSLRRAGILDFFQRERVTGRAKGIVEVDLEAGS